ncbi:hypothetical protein K2173_014170 [Erythroxylum novogranatense]|uniref:Homeobox domain-containing protein n=1 Tax=Erythroxylum novogranatense TaxID=1862640 RepID=A0AAV8SE62_9ROSI|nr:hypothetical protein K2173_014170 [Erythroxylum novogranatense]
MAKFFDGSTEIQASTSSDGNGIQTLHLMNPSYISSFSEAIANQQQQQQPPPSMFFFNPTTNTPGNFLNLPHALPPNHHLVGIPVSSNATSTNHDIQGRSSYGVVSAGTQYSLWGSMDHNSVATVPTGSDSGGTPDVVTSPVGFRRPVEVSPARQGLSLSLSSQRVQTPSIFRPVINNDQRDQIQQMHGHHVSAITSSDDMRVSANSPSSLSAVSNGVSGIQNMLLGSKYLKATQELLDEVANVGNFDKSEMKDGGKEKMKVSKESTSADVSGCGEGGESSTKGGGAELTMAQRQELQMKKAKLVNMLDEVEQRYRQYHQEMQVVVSSFEQAAGFGAAKSYTALALQTISKQFRCLKDAIAVQIKATSKSLGEDDCLGVKVEGSRLRYVDHQIRQQRALQQLGMIQNNAWRPQRGLPERAVSVLRAWLFEHFLHPYPKDSDKHMLAKQTGLTRSQVSNWFINARVRLWKPMVEEMYMEEMKEQEKDGNDENASKNGSSATILGVDSSAVHHQMDQRKLLQSKLQMGANQNASSTEISNSSISMSALGGSNVHPQAGFALIRPSEMEGLPQRSSKKPRSGNDMQPSPISLLSIDADMKNGESSLSFAGERLTKDGYPLIAHGSGFGAYPIGDLGRFNPHEQLTPRFSGNSVSLTLGLPHCESLSLSGTQQSYISSQNIPMGRRLEMGTSEPDFCGINSSQNSHSSAGFETISTQTRNRFAAQLLPDFVA